MKRKLFHLILLFVLFSQNLFSATYTLESPSKKLKAIFEDTEGTLTYTLLEGESTLVGNSQISILENKKIKILSQEQSQVDKTWKTVWGNFSEIRDLHSEDIFLLDIEGSKAKLVVRIFDDAFAFRFDLDDSFVAEKASFSVEYALDSGSTLYCPSQRENEPLEFKMSYLKSEKLRIPVVVEEKGGRFLGLLESDLLENLDFGIMSIAYNDKKGVLVSKNLAKKEKGKVLKTPWRLITVAKQVGDLSLNNAILNLATECKIDDTSWLKPVKSLWDWRVLGHKAPDGFEYKIDNASYFRLIDFAAKEGLDSVLIDDLWYTKVSTDNFVLAKDFDLDIVLKYAKEKGVKIFIYYDRKKGLYGDENMFEYFASLGIVGVKYGFMGKNISFSSFAIKEAAKNKLLINFHDGPVPYAGSTRTYPNAITREFCHAQQDSRRAFTQRCFVRQALINSLQGPLDMNNGNFALKELNTKGARAKMVKIPNSYISTVTSECARCLIINTGLLCLPDAPDAYEAKSDLFEFIKNLPVGKWDDSVMLSSKMSEYISMFKRKGEQYFVASVSVPAQTMDIALDFLKEGKVYDATIYQDRLDTNCISNPEAYEIQKIKVKKGDIIKANITENSGHCIWIR